MRLRYKLLALAAPGLGLVIIGALAFAMVVERSVERQEQELWDSRVSRAKNEIEHVAANLRGLVKDYAFWDEIIIFADQPSDLWARDELLWLEQFQGIDFVLVFDRSGAIVYASELAKSVNAAESLEASFGALRELALARPGEPALWVPQGERGVWLVAGTLHTSTARAFEPPGEGVLVIGYDVSDDFLEKLGSGLGGALELVAGESASPFARDGHRRTTLALIADVDGACFELIVGQGWAKVFPSSKSGFIGLVDGARGMHQATKDKAVTVSFLTDDVDAWFTHMKAQEALQAFDLRHQEVLDEGFSRVFVSYDPENHFLEFDQFVEHEDNVEFLRVLAP